MHSQRTIENEIESSSFWFQKKRFKKQHEWAWRAAVVISERCLRVCRLFCIVSIWWFIVSNLLDCSMLNRRDLILLVACCISVLISFSSFGGISLHEKLIVGLDSKFYNNGHYPNERERL
jgi:hypothetical protein